MIYKTDYVMTYGENRGFSLKEIYKFKPTYIEFLVQYQQDFEIDLNEFKKLPKPTPFYKKINFKIPKKNGQIISVDRKIFGTTKEAIDFVKKGGQIFEVDFSFSKSTVDILLMKSMNGYNAPEYKTEPINFKEQSDKQSFSKEHDETDWSNYNDNLDSDQQSIDFWNQF